MARFARSHISSSTNNLSCVTRTTANSSGSWPTSEAVKLSLRILPAIGLACCLVARAAGQSAPSMAVDGATISNKANDERVVLPESVPDPLEPVNRVVWAFNKGVLTGFVKPTAKIYRVVVAKPVRTGIGNFGRNITYPGRLINNLLQGKWRGAWDETERFYFNTVAGLGGFIDVAA